MAKRKSSPLDTLLGRLEDLDAGSLANLAQRLGRERRLLEAIVQGIRDGVLVVTASGRVEYANAAAHHLLGLEAGHAGDTLLWKMVPELARAIDLGALAAGGATALSRELELAYPEPRTVRLYLMPWSADEEEPPARRLPRRGPLGVSTSREPHYLVLLTDVTHDRQQTAEQIESARVNSLLLLAAGVAHELGNPLNSLTIHLQIIERQLRKLKPGPETAKLTEAVLVCGSEVRRLDGIISHFLEAIRPNPPQLAETDLLVVLEETLSFLGPELADAKIGVDVTCAGEVPAVMADREQVKQVFFNLLKNAREAISGSGRIAITAEADDTWVRLRLADSGQGIAPENLAKVFTPYFTTKPGGTGLGMMIVQRILRDHGGDVGLESATGQGTVVTLRFPRRQRRVRLLEG